MLGGSVIAGFAVAIGALGGHTAFGSVVLAVAWAFATGMRRCAWGRRPVSWAC